MSVLARWEETVQDESGNVVASPSVEVVRESDGALATLYADRSGLIGKSNPFTGTTEGLASFHVSGGAYKITITKDAFTRTLRYAGIGTAAELDTADLSSYGGMRYAFASSVSAGADAGTFRANNANLTGATAVYFADDDADDNDNESFLAAAGASSSTLRGYLILRKLSGGEHIIYSITGAASNASGYVSLPVSYVSGALTLVAGDDIAAIFIRTGDKGNTDPTPVSDDGEALGTTLLRWSDLFLAPGAVINFGSGDVTITHSTDTLTLAGGALILAGDPATALGAATKQYVDAVAAGLDPKASVRCRTTANVSLSGGGIANGTSHDGVTVATGERILVASQSAPAENGIYIVPASGAASRATDMDSWAEVPGASVFVEEGTTYADVGFVCTANTGGTLNTTAITFSQFFGPGAYTAGTGLAQSGLTFSFASIADLRILANISGGSAAPSANTLTAIIDACLGSTRGAIAYRGASGWALRTPGTSGHFLKSFGAGADPDYAAIPGGGDLLVANNLSDVASAATSRSNLGLAPPQAVGVLAPHEGLRINQASNSTVAIAITFAHMFNSTGEAKRLALSTTVDITASGANGLDTGAEASGTWYYIWAIAKADNTVAGLLSASSTAPTMPSGYTYKGLIGAVYNNGSSNFLAFYQRGKVVATKNVAVLTNGTGTTYAAISLAAAVPPTARTVTLTFGVGPSSGSASTFVAIASEGSGTTADYSEVFCQLPTPNGSNKAYAAAEFVMSTDQQVKYYVGGANAQASVEVTSYSYG